MKLSGKEILRSKVLIEIIIIGIILFGGWWVLNKIFITIPPPLPSGEVIITTDKAEYTKGEEISYTVRNYTHLSIWFAPYLILVTKSGKEYVTLSCLKPGIVREAPAPIELKPEAEHQSSWNQLFCDEAVGKNVTTSPGVYRIKFLYSDKWAVEFSKSTNSNEFRIK